ncbi:MAG: hypothetical protein SVJ22_06605 [Halobacteriota archaeon]|nr:hypothetical protein [Halobacteriota archaeon]
MQSLKTWFGIFKISDEYEISDWTLFSKDELVNSFLKEKDVKPIGMARGDFQFDLRDLAKSSGFVSSDEEYFKLLHDFGVDLAHRGVENSFSDDQLIIQGIKNLDDLDGIISLLFERLEDWNFFPISKLDKDMIESISESKVAMEKNRLLLENYINENMKKIAPNLSLLAGPLLGARLISISGGLKNLSGMPSSTIQVLGADKALFRHLAKGTPPPKHGIIFRHPLVHGAPWWQRGKIARVFASKLCIAARIDFYSGTLNEDLLADLNRRVLEIGKAYPNPPETR